MCGPRGSKLQIPMLKIKSCPSSTSSCHEVYAQQAGVVGLGQYIGGELYNSAKRDQAHRPHEADQGHVHSGNITNYKLQSQTCSRMAKCHGGQVVQDGTNILLRVVIDPSHMMI